jgi:hypothetical protein
MFANANSVALLRAGWDGPGSLPISAEVLSRAMFYVRTALKDISEASSPRFVPGGDGSIQIEWHTSRGELELDIDLDGNLSIWVRDHLSGAEFDGEDRDALALFYRWAPRVAARPRHVGDVPPAHQVAQFDIAA